MPNNKKIKLLTLILTLLFGGVISIPASAQTEKTDRAIQLFNQGEYALAMPFFKELLNKDPEDVMLNFYYGASRTENGFFSENDLNHLLKSKSGNIPLKINYYLGMQNQAQGNWNEALKYYNKFRITATSDQQEILGLAEKIQQCYNHENPYTLTESIEAVNQQKTLTQSDSVLQGSENVITSENITEPEPASKPITKPELTTGKPIKFQVNNEITYLNTSQFKTEKGKSLFNEAQTLQKELDFSLGQMESLRDEYRTANIASEREILGKKILSYENETYQLKEKITQLLLQARNQENEYWQKADPMEKLKFQSEIMELVESNAQQAAGEHSEPAVNDTSLTINSELLLGSAEAAPIVAESENQDELAYKIQIGAYSRGLPAYVDRLYKKLSLIRKIEHYTDENGVVVYTTGNLKNLDDAIKMRNQVRQEGVEDAFVVPYFNGKRITLEQAKKLEAGS